MGDVFDVAVVGAGAAAIAAGRTLAAANLSFLLIEATDRVGGRGRSVVIEGMSFDLGCGWLHSADRNPWTAMAELEEFELDRTPPSWDRQFAALGFSAREQAEAAAAYSDFERRMREAPPASDCAADALDADCRWNETIEARSSFVNGTSLAYVSIRDYLAYADKDTGTNWRLPAGFGALMASAARGLPIALSTRVTCIDRRTTPLRLATSAGTISARTVIVTVPTPVLAAATLRFDPPLDSKAEAAAALPLGLANKLFFYVDGAEDFDPDSHLLGNCGRAQTASYHLRPFGRPVIECFFGGELARQLEKEDIRGSATFAAAELAELFGSSIRRRLRLLTASEWGRAAMILGSYSHALPGESHRRAELARAVEDRIFFAGEGCSADDYSTAHGAWMTGEAAAKAAMGALTSSQIIGAK